MGDRKPKGYWQNWNNLEKELQPIIDKLNHFPIHSEFRESGNSSISRAIYKYHGGMVVVRKKLGYESKIRSKNYWIKWDNIQSELQPIINQLGHFPSQTELENLKKSSVSYAYKYHGGKSNVMRKMGYESNKKKRGYFKKFGNLEKELQPIIDKLMHFPSNDELKDMKRYDLIHGMDHHNGTNAVRELMGYKLAQKPNGYWKDLDNLVGELHAIIKELGHFPSNKELRKLGKSFIASAFNYHNGTNAVRELMGYKLESKVQDYWKNWENFKSELLPVIEKLGHFPTDPELRTLKKGSITNAIYKYHRGLEAVKQKMGYSETKQLENLLEDYIGGEKNG